MTDQHGIGEGKSNVHGDGKGQPRYAANPEAEEDNALAAETSSSLLFLGFGIPLVILIATGIFAIVNGHPFLVYLCFGVAAVLLVIAVIMTVRLVRGNRHRSHH